MKSPIKIIILTVLTLFIASCATISYTPRVSLDVSPITIHKSLMIEKFSDLTDTLDKKNPFGGSSVTNEKSLASNLRIEVTNAVLSDFEVNSCFSEVKRRLDKPDFIMRGEIVQFKGKSKFTKYGLISLCTVVGVLTWYFGMPIQMNITDVELKVRLYDKNDKLIGTYTGKSAGTMKYNLYNQENLAVASATNRSLSLAVAQIRTQIIKDIEKYER